MPYRPKEPEKYRDEAWLREKYHDEELSTSDIGDLCDCTKETIRRWLDRHGIDTRSKSEAAEIRAERPPHTTPDNPDALQGVNSWEIWDEEERKEFRQRMSENRMGEDNPMHEVTGSDHPQWNEEYDPEEHCWVYQNSRWQEARSEALERDEHECQECGDDGDHLHVHHITPIAGGGAHYDLENLTTLCAACHSLTHHREG